jgi:hypothetical protein
MSTEPIGVTLDHQAGTHRVFIIHLRLDADPARGRMAGRVRHTHTSDAAHFESVDELVAFIAGHLDVVRE